MLEQLFLVQLPQQILIFRPEPSRHSPTLEFKLKNLSYIHSLNKTKQPFTVF
jgi:1-acyl-sn-glycerol-3-phosphate acyltransferase